MKVCDKCKSAVSQLNELGPEFATHWDVKEICNYCMGQLNQIKIDVYRSADIEYKKRVRKYLDDENSNI